MKLLLALGMAFLVTDNCFGRIGETKQEIEKRYGQPISSAHPLAPLESIELYKKGDVRIEVGYWKGQVHYIQYYIPQMNGEEIAKCLSVNAANGKGIEDWEKSKDKPYDKIWNRLDGKVLARRNIGDFITFETVELIDAREDLRVKKLQEEHKKKDHQLENI